jgi:hypothetical protein
MKDLLIVGIILVILVATDIVHQIRVSQLSKRIDELEKHNPSVRKL